jgi:hypothetical protein
LLQPLQENHYAGLPFGIVRGYAHKYANAPNALGLLCACGERPRGSRPAQKRDELAPFHVPPEKA